MLYRNIEQALRRQPWLRLCNKGGVTKRLQEYTNGDVFIAYNTSAGCYELHSVSSQDSKGRTCNTRVVPEKLNGWLYHDFRAHENKKFWLDNQWEQAKKEALYTRGEELLSKRNRDTGLRRASFVLGNTI